jgi:hypothetical protein
MSEESELQSSIVRMLRALGFVVKSTNTYDRRRARVMAQDKGIPDLLVSHSDFAPKWIGMEVKTPGGKMKPEQQALLDEGRIVVVRSLQEALESVRRA